MSKYGTIPASSSSAAAAPLPEGSSAAPDSSNSSCARCPRRPSFRPWRELLDPRALSFPRGLTGARRRAHANLAHFAADYELVFLVVVSVSLLWRPRLLPNVLVCFFFLAAKVFPLILGFTLLELMLMGATASVLVSVPVGIPLVVVHAVLHCPADSADEEARSSIAWHRGIAPSCECDTPTAVDELA